MNKVEKSNILKYYTLFSILSLASYNIIIHDIAFFSNIFIQLAISLNSIFASYYLLYIDNVVLNGSKSLKSFFVAFTSEYLLIWSFVKLLGKSQDLTIYYTNYIYFGFILMHLGLYQRYPKVFDNFIKFNFGFSYSYFITHYFLQNYNLILILVNLVGSIIYNAYNTVTLDYMTILYTNLIYSFGLFEAIFGLIMYISSKLPKDNDYIFVVSCLIFGVSLGFAFSIPLSKVTLQLKDLKNKGDEGELKDEKLPIIAQSVGDIK